MTEIQVADEPSAQLGAVDVTRPAPGTNADASAEDPWRPVVLSLGEHSGESLLVIIADIHAQMAAGFGACRHY
jgi:hypothetical protein